MKNQNNNPRRETSKSRLFTQNSSELHPAQIRFSHILIS